MIEGPGSYQHSKPEYAEEQTELNRLAERTRNPTRVSLRLENGHFKSGEKGRFKYWGLKALKSVAPYLSGYCNKKLQELSHQNDEEKQAAARKIGMMTRHAAPSLEDNATIKQQKLSDRTVTVKDAVNYVNQNTSTRYVAPENTWITPPYLELARAHAQVPKRKETDWRPNPELIQENLKLEYRIVPDSGAVAGKISKAQKEVEQQQLGQKDFQAPLKEKPIPKLNFNQKAILKLQDIQEEKLEEYSTDQAFKGTSGSFTKTSLSDQKDDATTHYETETIPGFQGEIGVAHCQGLRKRMEDQTLCNCFTVHTSHGDVPVNLTALFDGHGGTTGSAYAKEHLIEHLKKRLEEGSPEQLTDAHIWNALKLAFVDLSNSIPLTDNRTSAGTTANVALQIGDKLWVANTGDSRAVFVPPKGNAKQLSLDAKPNDARFRPSIEKRGGQITGNESWGYKVNSIATARALGDHGAYGALTARPTITMYQKPPEGWKGSKLLQACDGLTDLVSSDQVGDLVQKAAARNMNNAQTSGFLTGLAFEAGSGDNISVMLTTLE